MRTIHGILGPIDPKDLGPTLMHEHITMADWSMRANFGTKVFDEQKLLPHTLKHLKRAKDAGIRTIVEGTPITAGRDVPFMRKVAEQSGMNIIASTGLYEDHAHWLVGRDLTDIYELLCDECRNGMAGTDSLPGIVKAAVGPEGVDPFIARLLDIQPVGREVGPVGTVWRLRPAIRLDRAGWPRVHGGCRLRPAARGQGEHQAHHQQKRKLFHPITSRPTLIGPDHAIGPETP